MEMPKDGTLRDFFAVVELLARRMHSHYPASIDSEWQAEDCFRVADLMLAARGTPAPALDESAIRKDERERCAKVVRVRITETPGGMTEYDRGYACAARAILGAILLPP